MRRNRSARRAATESAAEDRPSALSLRIQIRQAEEIRALAEESIDGNYEDFVRSLGAFATAANQRYVDAIELDIARLGEAHPDPDPLEGQRLLNECHALAQRHQTLTQTLDRLTDENQKLALELMQRAGE
jgi:hypothetical protein